jgi:hypothetical protein
MGKMSRQEKTCSKCRQQLPSSEFYADKSRPDGLTTFCKPCKREKQRLIAAKEDPEVRLQRQRIYYKKNKQACDERKKEWRSNNPAKPRELTAEQLERKRESARRHYERNKSTYLVNWARRRAAKMQRTINLSEEHLSQIDQMYAEAKRLTAETGVSHHVDHIAPLQGELVSGLHAPWNMRVVPAHENLSKGARVNAALIQPAIMGDN